MECDHLSSGEEMDHGISHVMGDDEASTRRHPTIHSLFLPTSLPFLCYRMPFHTTSGLRLASPAVEQPLYERCAVATQQCTRQAEEKIVRAPTTIFELVQANSLFSLLDVAIAAIAGGQTRRTDMLITQPTRC